MSLIERLQDWQDQRTWDEFYQTYWRLIYSVCLKSGLASDEAFDVVQETVLTVAKQWKKGQKYDPEKGSFKSWLLNITRWRIGDQLRKKMRHAAVVSPGLSDDGEDGRRTATIERFEDPEGDKLERLWNAEWISNMSAVALDKVKNRVSPKQYQIFHCYVVKGWEARKVMRELGVSMAQVYLAKHRVGSLVRKEIEALQDKLL